MSELTEPATVNESWVTLFAFTPRGGIERLFGPVRTLTTFEAAIEDSFGEAFEQPPLKLRSERFDATGALIERVRYDETGALADRAVFGYDAAGRVVERTHYDPVGQAYLHYLYSFDEHGRLVEMTGLSPEGVLSSSLKRRYDDAGRLVGVIEVLDRNGTTRQTRWRITYHDHMPAAEAHGEVSEDGRIVERLVHRYDSDGYIAESARLDADGHWQVRERLIYDPRRERGNWVRRVTESCARQFGEERWRPARVTYRRFIFFEQD